MALEDFIKYDDAGKAVAIDEDRIADAIYRIERQMQSAGIYGSERDGDPSNATRKTLMRDLERKLENLRRLEDEFDKATKKEEQGEFPSFLNVPGLQEFRDKSLDVAMRAEGRGAMNIGTLVPQGATLAKYTRLGAAEDSIKKSNDYGKNAQKAINDIAESLSGTGTTVNWDGEAIGIKALVKRLEKDYEIDLSKIDFDEDGGNWSQSIRELLGDQITFAREVETNAKKYVQQQKEFETEFVDLAEDTVGFLEAAEKGRWAPVVKYLDDEGLQEVIELEGTTAATQLLRDRATEWLDDPERGLVSKETLIPEKQFSAGTELSDSERDREMEIPVDNRLAVPEMEGAAIENELDLQEAEIEEAELQESFIDRVTDESQMVPEFGAPVSGGGGTGGDPEPGGLDEDTRQYIIDNFSMAGFLLQLPKGQLEAEVEVPPGSGNMVTVDNVMAYIDQNGITDTNQIKGMFLQTQWYKNTEPERRKWQAQWYGEGGEVNQTWADSNANQRALLDDEMDQIRREAKRLGLDLDDEALWNLAFEAKSMGFDTYEIRENFVKTYEDALFASDEGRFEVTRNDIREDAADYMMTWSDEDLDDAARRVYLGETTVEEIEAGLRAEAKAANPALASLIDQGYTPKMYFASYKKEAENLLERNVDFLGKDRGLYDQLTGTEWDKEGARPMTRAEFGRTLRATPEWQYTDNARDAAYDAASQIARMFGAIG